MDETIAADGTNENVVVEEILQKLKLLNDGDRIGGCKVTRQDGVISLNDLPIYFDHQNKIKQLRQLGRDIEIKKMKHHNRDSWYLIDISQDKMMMIYSMVYGETKG